LKEETLKKVYFCLLIIISLFHIGISSSKKETNEQAGASARI
jgi:hypothetical protein